MGVKFPWWKIGNKWDILNHQWITNRVLLLCFGFYFQSLKLTILKLWMKVNASQHLQVCGKVWLPLDFLRPRKQEILTTNIYCFFWLTSELTTVQVLCRTREDEGRRTTSLWPAVEPLSSTEFREFWISFTKFTRTLFEHTLYYVLCWKMNYSSFYCA